MYIWMHKVSPEKEGNFSAMEYVGCRKCASKGVKTSFNSEKVCCKGIRAIQWCAVCRVVQSSVVASGRTLYKVYIVE